ncbi:hypothetical protein CYMTET_5985 [Cymbomonas tetramitiformis]|uniref:EGF-like domain-containing protein n=1 Tax=Cymbomonas tetramitiformis TaxID=36881 RepID=A0AAE0GYE5_9CHLO|nr:hypothetical protein CYMTET_5985 [Cymbomonas tetramitiformis]
MTSSEDTCIQCKRGVLIFVAVIFITIFYASERPPSYVLSEQSRADPRYSEGFNARSSHRMTEHARFQDAGPPPLPPPAGPPRLPRFTLPSPTKCAGGCGGGTCYEPLGRCDCPPGFAGDRCEDQGDFATVRGRDAKGVTECAIQCGQAQRRGWCELKRPPGPSKAFRETCVCALGWKGPECGTKHSTYCLAGCSCFGECIQGFCKCQPGHFGVDCSQRMGPHGIPVRWGSFLRNVLLTCQDLTLLIPSAQTDVRPVGGCKASRAP